MTDQEALYYELLLLRCQAGERDAFEELIRRWERQLYYFLRRLIDDEHEAWQVLQETWLGVLKNIGQVREGRRLPAWVYGVARRTAMHHLRTRYAQEALLKEAEGGPAVDSGPTDARFENAELVHYGLGKISLRHREVLTLHFLKELSLEDISEVLEVPVGTVKSRLFYAKAALKAALAGEDKC